MLDIATGNISNSVYITRWG